MHMRMTPKVIVATFMMWTMLAIHHPAAASARGAEDQRSTAAAAALRAGEGWGVGDLREVLRAAVAVPVASADAQAKRRRVNPVAIGAVSGAAAAAGLTYLAAARYGENEGGEFCGRCFVQWSAVTVPAGAGAGAAIGWGIGRTRHSVSAIPVISPRSTGLVLSARF
jgi:hypothetical protein